MTDVREDILQRLVEIGATVGKASRNELELSDRQLPAIVVLEGDEEVPPVAEGRSRPASTPRIVRMLPEICIVVIEGAADCGPALSRLRIALINAVLFDADLVTISGSNGSTDYRGMQSDLGLGRAMIGRMALKFAITYVLKPSQP